MLNNSNFSEEFQQEFVSSEEIWDDPDLSCPDQVSRSDQPVIDPATELDVANAIISNPIVSTAICGFFDPSLITDNKAKTIVKCVLDHAAVYNCNPTFEQIKSQVERLAESSDTIKEQKLEYLLVAKFALDQFDHFKTAEYYIDQAKQLTAKKVFLKAVAEAMNFSKPLSEIFDQTVTGINKAQKIIASNKWRFRDYSLLKSIAETQTDDFLIENWLEFKTLGMLTGDPFSGKSCIVTKIINGICETGVFGGRKVQKDCGMQRKEQKNNEASQKELLELQLMQTYLNGILWLDKLPVDKRPETEYILNRIRITAYGFLSRQPIDSVDAWKVLEELRQYADTLHESTMLLDKYSLANIAKGGLEWLATVIPAMRRNETYHYNEIISLIEKYLIPSIKAIEKYELQSEDRAKLNDFRTSIEKLF